MDTLKTPRIRKPDNRNRSEEKMIKYYNDPEKQIRLQGRIKAYRDTIIILQTKIIELEKYIKVSGENEGINPD